MSLITKLKSLARLERARVELTLARIQNIPPLMFVFNAFLLTISMMARIKNAVVGILDSLGISKTDLHKHQPLLIPQGMPRTVLPDRPTVLLIVEDTIAQCFHYRVEQRLEQLSIIGLPARWVSWRDLDRARYELHFAHIVIFYRVPAFTGVLETIKYTRALNKIVVYDIDDLVFDRASLEEKFTGPTGQLPAHERKSMLRGADLYRLAIEHCSFALASTEPLRCRIAELLGADRCFTAPNGIGETILKTGSTPAVPKEPGTFNIFYGSGTKTHDEDFALVAAPLGELMEAFPHVRLLVVGYLTIPEALTRFRTRITKLPPLDFATFVSTLRAADVNIAPLEPGLFADCKSEIKWLEAAVCGVPSVVSNTAVYQQVVEEGVTGLVADGVSAWHGKLARFLEDPALSSRIGAQAKRAALANYHPATLAQRLQGALNAILEAAELLGISGSQDPDRPHIMFVNTLYPPQAMGGATSVLLNIVRHLRRHYADHYRVSVVTYDMKQPVPYRVRQYAWEGISVTAVSVPPGPEMDWNYRDAQIREIFERILNFEAPDLVHFHSVQRLTGSVLEACERAQVPFVVTVHDAWWLSDHQFLLDRDGQAVGDLQRNPVVAAQTSSHLPGTLKRASYLAARLARAARVFAVSDYQADLYRRNGFRQVITNRNGVDIPARRTVKARSRTDVLQLGYVGGICTHKGFFLLKSALSELALPNLSLLVVDFDVARDVRKVETWGRSEVTFVGPFDYDERAHFYESIDVLIAPSMWPESFGLVTREAVLSGRWVVASDAGGLAEDIVDGVNGHVFPMGDHARLKEILSELHDRRARYLEPAPHSERGGIVSIDQQVAELNTQYQLVLDAQIRGASEGDEESQELSYLETAP